MKKSFKNPDSVNFLNVYMSLKTQYYENKLICINLLWLEESKLDFKEQESCKKITNFPSYT